MHRTDSLVDLEALVGACRDPRSRELISEAVACYRAGAFRACIVTTWLAVVFDFVHKIRELATGNDPAATKALETFETLRKKGDVDGSLRFERDVLDQCTTTFEFVSVQERLDLARLLEDRHRCAHPAMRSEDQRFDPHAC